MLERRGRCAGEWRATHTEVKINGGVWLSRRSGTDDIGAERFEAALAEQLPCNADIPVTAAMESRLVRMMRHTRACLFFVGR